jgi:hypothetical protein
VSLTLILADREALAWSQAQVQAHHYLRRPVDGRTRPLAYVVSLDGERVGCLIFGRPESTRCYQGGLTYGSLDDVARGRAQFSRWEVLNLARVWLAPAVQAGGTHYRPGLLPGFTDRRGVWRSTLASTVVGMALARVGVDYLLQHPPCFLEEPYQLRVCLSYCDTRVHRGTLYQVSGFALARRNGQGIETWTKPVPSLTAAQDEAVRQRSQASPRAQQYRARRQQLCLLDLA